MKLDTKTLFIVFVVSGFLTAATIFDWLGLGGYLYFLLAALTCFGAGVAFFLSLIISLLQKYLPESFGWLPTLALAVGILSFFILIGWWTYDSKFNQLPEDDWVYEPPVSYEE